MNSILDIEVSCFASYYKPGNPKLVNLLVWLHSKKYKTEIEAIRLIPDKVERDKLKALLPAITPSCIATYKNENSIIKHSGFIQFDIDYKGNEKIVNFAELKKQICKIKNVAYCGLSASGLGYWGLIPIPFPDKHREYFMALEKLFAKYGITIDPACKDVSRLRGYSFDPDAYFNHNAEVFRIYDKPQPKATAKPNYKRFGSTNANAFDKAVQTLNKTHSFFDGGRHPYIVHLASICNSWGLPESETLSGCLTFIQTTFPESEIQSIVKGIYKAQHDSFGKYQYTDYKHTVPPQVNIPPNPIKERVMLETEAIPQSITPEPLPDVTNSNSSPTLDKNVEPLPFVQPTSEPMPQAAVSIPTPVGKVKHISYLDYVGKLHMEAELLMADGYPADWDTTDNTPYIDEKTKTYIKMAKINPELLNLRDVLEFE